ncbi:hypothetical protein LCGC14_2448450, partial [marine sediment metagenome]
MVRADVTDRYYRVFTYQDVDRVPDIEFGYWPQTIRRWLGEGLPAEYASESQFMFSGKLDALFGFEPEGHRIALRLGMNPEFAEEVLEDRDGSVVARDSAGVVAERYLCESDQSSIPRFLEFPVSTPAHWQQLKGRYLFDDPIIDDNDLVVARATINSGLASEGLFLFFVGLFFAGQPAQQIVLQGDFTIEGGNYDQFIHVAFNDSQQVVFVANTINPTSQGVY